MATLTIEKGYYLRTEVTPHSFHFDLPANGKPAAYESMDELWESIGGGRRKVTNHGEQTVKGTKSTLSSPWVRCGYGSHTEIGTKISYAPEIYSRAQGTSDTADAATAVKEYKTHAARVLGQYYDANREPDQAMADLINTKACLVYEVKIVLMRVTDQPIDGVLPSKKDGLYRQSKVVRKFYTFLRPLENLLNSFSEVLCEVGTNVDYQGNLILVRSDGVTARTGRAAGYRHFKIERTSAIGSDNDQQLQSLVSKLFAKMNNTPQG
jgi:hypothetical protein